MGDPKRSGEVIEELFSSTTIIFVAAFCYTMGYFELFKIPEAPGIDLTLAFYLRTVLSSILHFKTTALVHLLILSLAFIIPRVTVSKGIKTRFFIMTALVAGSGVVTYKMGLDYFKKRTLPEADFSVELATDPDLKAKEAVPLLAYASESGIFYWLECKSKDSSGAFQEIWVEGMNGGSSCYHRRLDSTLLRFCKSL